MSEFRLNVWIIASRPKTLTVAIAPILVASAMAWEDGGFHLGAMLVCTLCAVLITIGTNFCNDYSDFIRGADTSDRKGPTRVTQAGLIQPRHLKTATLVIFIVAAQLGGYLIYRGGFPILIIGVLSILSGILYTAGPWPYGYKGLGDIFVLIFFGPVAVGGAYYVQTLSLPPLVIIAGLATGLLATAILVVNNIRDREEDQMANKKTLVVRYGRTFGVFLWIGCITVAACLPLVMIYIKGGHFWAGFSAVILLPAIGMLNQLVKKQDASNLNPLLGQTALLLLFHSTVFSVGWIL